MQTTRSADGTTIAYDVYGSGPAVILVSGAAATRAHGAPLAQVLDEHFTVYGYDRRGRADSGDTPPYTVEREIEDLAALIDVAGGSAFVLGRSSGAVLALRAAATGVPMTRLVVYEPPFIVTNARPPAPDNAVEHLDRLVAEGRRSEAGQYFMTEVVGIPAEYVAGMTQDPGWAATEAVAHTLAYDGRVMGDTMSGKPLSDEPWNRITIPTLVLDGGASESPIREGARDLVSKLPNVEYRSLEGQGHGPADDVLAPELVRFFLGKP